MASSSPPPAYSPTRLYPIIPNEQQDLNYFTPAEEYKHAVDFANQARSAKEEEFVRTESSESRLKKLIRSINESTITYPIVTILMAAVTLILTCMQKQTNIVTKIIIIIMFVLLLIYTVYIFKKG
jgi:hypothetical protein